MSTYHIHKFAAIACCILAGLANFFLGVGNSLFLMLAAIYFQLNAIEYAEKK